MNLGKVEFINMDWRECICIRDPICIMRQGTTINFNNSIVLLLTYICRYFRHALIYKIREPNEYVTLFIGMTCPNTCLMSFFFMPIVFKNGHVIIIMWD
jgi:hypothetical protein